MLWTKVRYENIGLLRKGEIELDKHLYVTGDNFTGKTTFLELLPLLLYNKLPIKKMALQDAITWSKNYGFVEGTIIHNEHEYVILREADTSGKRVKQTAKVYEDGKLLNPDATVASATQILTNKIIPFNMFMTSVYMASTGSFTASDLVYMENSKRKDVLSELVVRPDEWKKLETIFLEASREKINPVFSDDLYDELERTIEKLEDAYEEEKNAAETDNENRKKLVAMRKFLLVSKREMDSIISRCESFINKHSFDGWNEGPNIEELLEVSDEYEQTEQKLEDLGKVGKEPYKPTKHGEVCEGCDLYKESHSKYINWEETKKKLHELTERAERLEEKYIPREDLERYDELLERNRNIETLSSSIDILDKAIDQMEEKMQAEPEYTTRIAAANKIGQLTKQRETLKERLSQEGEKIIHASVKKDYISACSILANAFGNRGIILSNLEEVLDKVGEKSTEICSEILGEDLELKWVIRPRGNRDDIDLLVSDRAVETKSGAEQKIARLATRIAFCETLDIGMILNDEMPENLSLDKVKALGEVTSERDIQIIGTGSKTEIPNYNTLVLKRGIVQI